MKKVAVWALVAAALAAGSAACTAEEPSEAAGTKPAAHETEAPKSVKKALRKEQKANPETQEITAENVVDVMYLQNPKAKKAFCELYAVTGYDAGFKAFHAATASRRRERRRPTRCTTRPSSDADLGRRALRLVRRALLPAMALLREVRPRSATPRKPVAVALAGESE